MHSQLQKSRPFSKCLLWVSPYKNDHLNLEMDSAVAFTQKKHRFFVHTAKDPFKLFLGLFYRISLNLYSYRPPFAKFIFDQMSLNARFLMTTPSWSRAHVFRDSRSPFDFAPAQRSLPSSRSVDERRRGHSACPGTLSTCNYTHTPFPTHPNEAAGDAATQRSRPNDEGHGLK